MSSSPSPSPSSPESPSDEESPPSPPAPPLPGPVSSPTPGFSPLRPPSSLFPPSNDSSRGLSTGAVVGIVMGGGVFVLVILTLFCLFRKKKQQRKDDEAAHYDPPARTKGMPMFRQILSLDRSRQQSHLPPFTSSSHKGSESNYPDHSPSHPELVLGVSKGTFTYEELAAATNDFSEANVLGQGGFGYVYKGILPDGKEIAVKQLKAGSCQGEREFQAEIEIISRVHHKHLVSLIGYCMAGDQRLLVYEFLPNSTLEFHLHGKGRPPMEWSLRLKIAIGSAKGLSFLHEICNPKIIHRDIKTANILIDSQFQAKVADFGLAKIAPDTNTHVSTRVMGTFGYLAPEYAASGKLTEKSDVYSFGVILLELITGRRPFDAINAYGEGSLVEWARPLLLQALENKNFEGLADTKLNNEYDREEMARMVACASACVLHSACRRPRMDQVECALEGNIWPSDPSVGTRPGHNNVSSSNGGSTDYDTNQSNLDMNKFRNLALGTSEYNTASSEYNNSTSDYTMYPSGSSTEG